MKLKERIALIKAGYTKEDIATFESETEPNDIDVSGEEGKLDIIAQSVAELANRVNTLSIANSANKDGETEPENDIYETLRNMLTGGNEDEC